MTRRRVVLTSIWLASLLLALIAAEAYLYRHTADGYRILLAQDRGDVLQPLLVLYSGYLGGVLAFWFAKPFASPPSDQAAKIRFRIALACTLAFNLIVLGLVAQKHISLDLGLPTVVDDITFARNVALWMSFLVAPVNLYYFGSKVK